MCHLLVFSIALYLPSIGNDCILQLPLEGEIPAQSVGNIKSDSKWLKKFAVHANEEIDVIRTNDNPKGKWLIRNKKGICKFFFIFFRFQAVDEKVYDSMQVFCLSVDVKAIFSHVLKLVLLLNSCSYYYCLK